MDNNQLNQDMKRLFNHYQPELDTDEIWENIEPFLDKKKKKDRFFFWWGLAGLAIILIVALFLFPQNEMGTKHENLQTVSSIETQPTPSKEQSASSINSSNSNNENRQQNNNSILSSNETTQVTRANNNTTPPLSTTSKPISPNNKNSALLLSQEESNESTKNASVNSVEPVKENTLAPIWETELLPTLPVSLLEANKEEVTTSSKRKRRKKIAKKTKKIRPSKKKKWRHNLQFFMAPELAIQQLSAVGGAERELVQQRKETERLGMAYRMGLNYQLIQTNGLILSTGLNYEQINNLFNWTNTTSRIDPNYTGTISITVNAIGDTIRRQTGPKRREVITTETRQATNRYRFINIPVGLGLEKRFRNSHMKFTGGVNINLAFFMSGYILNRQSEPIKMNRSNPNSVYHSTFRKRTRMGLWASYEYSRAINPQISWLIAPEIHVPLGSLTKAEYQIKHRYYSLQLRLGINCMLSGKK